MSELNLQSYTILDSEPLHDLKGHLTNLLDELPHILVGDDKKIVKQFIKDKKVVSGSDTRVVLLEVNNLLQCKNVSEDIKMLLITAVKISERLYSSDDKRTPKSVLQLYNCTWLHHELCKSLFTQPKELTYGKFFGIYLHSLVVHAPRQYEIICLKSINTENQERIFEQAKSIAHKCTNRKPDCIISQVSLRIQAREITGRLSDIFHKAESRVGKIASKAPFNYTGTVVSKAFIEQRSHSWQAHLSRISAYLINENVWWHETPDNYVFFDGDNDQEYHDEGPILKHFRSCTIQDIEKQSAEQWKYILENHNIKVPAQCLRIFDENGDFVKFRETNNNNTNNSCEFEECLNDSQCNIICTPNNDTQFEQPSQSLCTPIIATNADQSSETISTPNFLPLLSSTPVDKSKVCRQLINETNSSESSEVNCMIMEPICSTVKYVGTNASLLAEIFGDSPELVRYDMLNEEAKLKKGHVSKSAYYERKNLLANFQAKVLAEHTNTLKQLNELRSMNFVNEVCEDTRNELSTEDVLYSKCVKLKQLMKKWNMKFT